MRMIIFLVRNKIKSKNLTSSMVQKNIAKLKKELRKIKWLRLILQIRLISNLRGKKTVRDVQIMSNLMKKNLKELIKLILKSTEGCKVLKGSRKLNISRKERFSRAITRSSRWLLPLTSHNHQEASLNFLHILNIGTTELKNPKSSKPLTRECTKWHFSSTRRGVSQSSGTAKQS